MNSMDTGRTLVLSNLFWEANMGIHLQRMLLDSRNRQWKIYSRNLIAPPNFIGEHAHVEDSPCSGWLLRKWYSKTLYPFYSCSSS